MNTVKALTSRIRARLIRPAVPAPSIVDQVAVLASRGEYHELVILDHQFCCRGENDEDDMESCIEIAWSNGDLPIMSGCTCGRYSHAGDMLSAEEGWAQHRRSEAVRAERIGAQR
ncbi:hypothetical protein [Nocardia fluminea]|uniref:hypothetical protein n=1 Tax=Nocardia fluminea TaxID=134984 RepID=UPI003658244E